MRIKCLHCLLLAVMVIMTVVTVKSEIEKSPTREERKKMYAAEGAAYMSTLNEENVYEAGYEYSD